jgi:uncharacterized protein with von Willebrand factor type A (vWA) domain
MLILLCIPLSTFAQTDHIEPLIKKYSTFNDCSTVVLSKEMMEQMYKDSGVESLQAISVEDPALLDILRNDVEKFIKGYAQLMSVNSNGTNVEIYHVEQHYKSKLNMQPGMMFEAIEIMPFPQYPWAKYQSKYS